ncbi:hypothetical protein AX16_008549 [Volvariella volvacea WC 439]|nr:hypothetical protein AX16_008549 [Volvariella volvacea WC 439]
MSAQNSPRRGFGEVTLLERVQVFSTILQLPLALIWSLITSPFTKHNSFKSWKRILSDTSTQFLIKRLNSQQIQYMLPKSTLENYEVWVKKKEDRKNMVEEVGEDTRLLWVGEKRKEKVIVYCHGGAFAVPMQDFMLDFLEYIHAKLKAKGLDVGVAVLNYSLITDKVFPGQLKEISAALSHLLASGTRAEDINFIGDFSGANLMLQLLSHLIHPLEDVPPVPLNGCLGGMYMISPWTMLLVDKSLAHGSHPANTTDTINFLRLHQWGRAVLVDVSESGIPYIDPLRSPEDWYKDAQNVVERIFIVAGELECLKESIVIVGERLKKWHGRVDLVVQKNGVHEDLLCDFAAAGGKEPDVGEIMDVTISWLVEGFRESG